MNRWIQTESPDQTRELGAEFARKLKPGNIVYLIGDLGAGKTTFMKGLAKGLGLKGHVDQVVSPTFVLIKQYPCKTPLYHIDLYRLDRVEDSDWHLIEECFQEGAITCLEWAEKIRDKNIRDYYRVDLRHKGPRNRIVRFQAFGRLLR